MTKEAQIAIADNAVRWCNNILVEVRQNHGRRLHPYKLEKLKEACLALREIMGPDPSIHPDEGPETRVLQGQTWADYADHEECIVQKVDTQGVHLEVDDIWPIDDFLDQFYQVETPQKVK